MDDERKNSIDLGSNVKVNFGTLYIRPSGHDSNYSFAQSFSNFPCRLWMIRGGPLFILGHGVIGQVRLCPPVRGCHALRCLVSLYIALMQGDTTHIYFGNANPLLKTDLFLNLHLCGCVNCEAYRHIGITLSGICLSVRLCVCLSGSHTFLVVTNSYVSQVTRAFLRMLPLF